MPIFTRCCDEKESRLVPRSSKLFLARLVGLRSSLTRFLIFVHTVHIWIFSKFLVLGPLLALNAVNIKSIEFHPPDRVAGHAIIR